MSSKVARMTTDLFPRHQRTILCISSPPPPAPKLSANSLSPLTKARASSSVILLMASCSGRRRSSTMRPGHLVHPLHVVDEHDPPVRRIVVPAYHPVLGQPVHELRRGRRRDLQLLGQLPNRPRPTRQRDQNLNVPRRNLNVSRQPAARDLPHLHRTGPLDQPHQRR